MSSVVIAGDVSGSVTLQAPSAAGTTTLTLPATSATIATNVNGDLYPLVSGTAVASTSGTSITFTGIPSWAKRITVMFNGVSLSSTASYLIQIGTSGGIENTGYVSQSSVVNTGANTVNSTSGFPIFATVAAMVNSGSISLCNMTGNLWTASGVTAITTSNNSVVMSAGVKQLAATLDRVRITTTSGTDTFDAGSINILYE